MTKGHSICTVRLAALALTAALAGCHPQTKAADNPLVAGASPGQDAATRALAKAIQVDPGARRTAPAAKSGGVRSGGYCLDGLAYARGWAAKLPADLPVHPRATLQEAAGHDGPCKARVVSFTVPGDRAMVIAWYAARAKAAGYSADRDDNQGDWTLTGGRGDAAYDIMAAPTRAGVTPVDYVWVQGR